MAKRRTRQRRTTGEKVVIGIAILGAVGIPAALMGGTFLKERAENIALARDWSVDGRPCPQITRAQFDARRLKANKGLIYEDVKFYRQIGHMSCSSIINDGGTGLGVYAVCQFTGPNVLRVVTAKGEWIFEPGMGQPATIATPHGEAHCVMASNFTLTGDRRGVRDPMSR